MATLTQNWLSGGGQVTVTYEGKGSGDITVFSTPNTLPLERSMKFIIATTDKSKQVTLTVVQSAATRDYVSGTTLYVHNGSVSGTTATLNDYSVEKETVKYDY